VTPGYAVDPETEAQVWEVFQTWSPHFKARLAESGIPGLLHRDENLVERVENAISSSSTLYVYDYDHWLTTRDVLEILVEHAPTGLSQEDAASLAALDARLEPLIRPGKTPLVHSRTHESCWWHQGLPPLRGA